MSYDSITEPVVVNCFGIFLMILLLLTRMENNRDRSLDNKLFSGMIYITIVNSAVETITFVIDGKVFPYCRFASYLFNFISVTGTDLMAYTWSIYVFYRVYKSVKRTKRASILLGIPFIINIILNIVNLSGNGITFSISEDNVYSRGTLNFVLTITLFFYYLYSIFIVQYSKRKGTQVKFFPIYYFIVPCILGTIIQAVFYGVALGWASVAAALVFVYIQLQSQAVYEDSLSGLYNRRYMEYILNRWTKNSTRNIYGIMFDANGFKQINDIYGHNTGDDAIRRIGMILGDATPDNGAAIRYAGDEFIILIYGGNERTVNTVMDLVNEGVDAFNETETVPYILSLSMGYSRYDTSGNSVEDFLAEMDLRMYESKERHYSEEGNDRRSGRDRRGGIERRRAL
jgi:diguanylate cyclase (GGDEF)-like protein